jgi:hypothetical protein
MSAFSPPFQPSDDRGDAEDLSSETSETANLTLRLDGETLIAEWDNRTLRKNRVLTLLMPLFWMVWAPCTLLMTYNFVSVLSSGGAVNLLAAALMFLWLIAGYYGTFAIPAMWLMRSTVERIEIDNRRYRHYFLNRRWLFPKDWEAESITGIEFGKRGKESITTLSVRRRWRRDLVAYWAGAEFRWRLFKRLRDHLKKIDSPIRVTTI